jgi:hypothetical protein
LWRIPRSKNFCRTLFLIFILHLLQSPGDVIMALFFVEAVQFDGSGQKVEKVRWGKSKGGEITPPAFVAEPRDASVDEVIDVIANGDEVITKFNIAGEVVMGPLVQVATHADGSKGITTAVHDVPGRTLADLPRF